VRRTGHSAAYLTGAGVAASGFGLPDIGLVTATEMAERVRMIVGVLGEYSADRRRRYWHMGRRRMWYAPFGSTSRRALRLSSSKIRPFLNVRHLPDKELVDAAEFEQTLAAALDCRSDDDFLVVARTDARAPLGLDEAIDRGNRYAQAGADIIFVEAPEGIDEIERIAREVHAPLLINLVPAD